MLPRHEVSFTVFRFLAIYSAKCVCREDVAVMRVVRVISVLFGLSKSFLVSARKGEIFLCAAFSGLSQPSRETN